MGLFFHFFNTFTGNRTASMSMTFEILPVVRERDRTFGATASPMWAACPQTCLRSRVADVADLPDMHGQVVGQEFGFRRGTGAAGRFQLVESPCLPAPSQLGALSGKASAPVPSFFLPLLLSRKRVVGHAGTDDPRRGCGSLPSQFLLIISLEKGMGELSPNFQPFPSGGCRCRILKRRSMSSGCAVAVEGGL